MDKIYINGKEVVRIKGKVTYYPDTMYHVFSASERPTKSRSNITCLTKSRIEHVSVLIDQNTMIIDGIM